MATLFCFFLPALAQDIVFAKTCLEKAAFTLAENPRLVTDEVLSLGTLAKNIQTEADAYNQLLQQTRMTFPGGTVIDMRATTVVSSEGLIKKEIGFIAPDEILELARQKYSLLQQVGRYQNISFDEYMVFLSYKGTGFKKMNTLLRWPQFASLEEEKNFVVLLRYMNSLLNRLEPFKGMVRRGATLAPEVIAQLQVGQVFKFNTYLSTSIKRAMYLDAKPYNRVVFMLDSYSGRPVEMLDPGVSSITEFEAEVLFKPGAIFKVLKVEKTVDEVVKIYAQEL